MAQKSPEIINLEKKLSKLEQDFKKELQSRDKKIKKLESDNTKLIKQNQINTQRIMKLEKQRIQNGLDLNRLESQINNIIKSMNR